MACGSEIKERVYQMRAADEAHTSVWSCDMCPLDPSRISFSKPRRSTMESYPRKIHARVPSDPKHASTRPSKDSSFLELHVPLVLSASSSSRASKNGRRPCTVPDGKYACPSRAYFCESGLYANEIVREVGSDVLSPSCSVKHVLRYHVEDESALGSWEIDGLVYPLDLPYGLKGHFYERKEGERRMCTVVVPMESKGWSSAGETFRAVCFAALLWPGIAGFLGKDHLATINNLSPRAWDSKRIQKKGAIYTPKVDGERVYAVVFPGVMHVFSKSRGYPHIGYKPLGTWVKGRQPVVIDAENTVSHGIIFIDMLTDSKGRPSPRERDYRWSLEEFRKLGREAGGVPVRLKPYTHSLLEAEKMSALSPYPTDGVIALWPSTTTSRKMKLEKSIELTVTRDGALCTSDGDEVFENVSIPEGTKEGDIMEVRFKLCPGGKDVMAKPIFKRVDKASANSTSAVMAVLSSFGSVRRDDETRRREVLMWCESVKHYLVKSALAKRGSRKVVLDVGTGTGQSLDVLSPNRGVSYLLVEPSAERCEMLKRRTGVRKAITDPREVMSAIRPLKSGAQTYVIANMELSQIVSEEELMKFIKDEVAFVSATFSAHFVVSELYDICSYWQMPMVGCTYMYDNVDVGGSLVDALGVSMKRVSDTACAVRWGRDEEYAEPYTTVQEYQPFCAVTRAIDIVPPPNKESDEDAWDICSKVYLLENF